VISLKPGGKVAREGHLLDLLEIKSTDPREIELIFKNFAITASTEMSDDVIHVYEEDINTIFQTYLMKSNLKSIFLHPEI
jgi:hypothetical protein